MNDLLRLIVVGRLLACVVLIITVGMARSTTNLFAPVHLLLFAIALVLYLLPTGLALCRDCKADVWIARVNVLL